MTTHGATEADRRRKIDQKSTRIRVVRGGGGPDYGGRVLHLSPGGSADGPWEAVAGSGMSGG